MSFNTETFWKLWDESPVEWAHEGIRRTPPAIREFLEACDTSDETHSSDITRELVSDPSTPPSVLVWVAWNEEVDEILSLLAYNPNTPLFALEILPEDSDE